MELRSPRTPKEFEDYFNLRWKILRSPWNQSHESEKDEFEKAALHVGAFEDDLLVGVGRIHAIDEKKAQVRYMAVLPEFAGRGIGKLILEYLEAHAKESGFHSIELNSRDTAVQFYSKQGYDLIKKAHVLYGEVSHTVMRKVIIAEGE